MSNSFLLLVDGSSYLLLVDGSSKLIIDNQGVDRATGGGFVYHTPNQIKKKIDEVEMQAQAVAQTIVDLQNKAYAQEMAALDLQDVKKLAKLNREIEKNQRLVALERDLLNQLMRQREMLRIRRNNMLVMAIANPFGSVLIN